jgi:hypothetical protein
VITPYNTKSPWQDGFLKGDPMHASVCNLALHPDLLADIAGSQSFLLGLLANQSAVLTYIAELFAYVTSIITIF